MLRSDINFQLSVFKFQFSIELVELVRRWYGEGSLLFCTMDFAFEFILSLFLPQKRETEKARRICNDAKSQRLRALKFLCVSESLRLCVFNILTRFLQGGRMTALTIDLGKFVRIR